MFMDAMSSRSSNIEKILKISGKFFGDFLLLRIHCELKNKKPANYYHVNERGFVPTENGYNHSRAGRLLFGSQ